MPSTPIIEARYIIELFYFNIGVVYNLYQSNILYKINNIREMLSLFHTLSLLYKFKIKST